MKDEGGSRRTKPALKVAMIGQKGLPATFGGIERHCEELCSRLAALGCDVTVFCRPYYSSKKIRESGLEQTGPRRYLYRGINLEMLPSLPTKHLDAASHCLACIPSSVLRDYDILHFHALGPTLFSLIPHFLRKRTVATVHGLDWQRGKWGSFARKVLQLGEKTAASSPDALIVVSRTLRRYFLDRYQKETFYIPNGIVRPEQRPAREIATRWKLKRDSYILFLGRLVPEKGCHYLIEAFGGIETDKALVVAGGASHSDDYIRKLHKMAEGDGRILFTDYVYGELLDEIFSNAFLYVHPSDLEGLPLALLEALSYGNCVLASDIPENAEVIAPDGKETYGFLFEKGNVSHLRSRMENLLSHPMLVKEMSGRVEPYVVESYNWDRIAEQTLEVYRSVLDKRG